MPTSAIDWKPWQRPAIEFLHSHSRANLYAGMGSGKTVICLTLLRELQLLDSLHPVLVIAPLRVCRDVWPTEIEQWQHLAGMTCIPILGSAHERHKAASKHADIHCINYENIPWLIHDFLYRRPWPYRTVIADESTRLKSFRLRKGGRRAAELAHVAHRQCERWINLTGTPAPNGLQDLWGQQWFVDGGASLGRSFTAFQQRWFRPRPVTAFVMRWEPLSFAQREIETAIAPTTLSIDARKYFDIAEPIENTVWVDLPNYVQIEYKRMEREFYAELENGVVTAANAGVKVQKLLQFANGAVYHEDKTYSIVHDEKIEALKSVIEEANGANILCAYRYISDLNRLSKAFPYARELREKGAIEDWNNNKIRLLLAHPKSAGHGLNLQHGGHHLVYFGDDWNLEDDLQILERIGPLRQKQSGYDRPVFVTRIAARGTMDEVVRVSRANKTNVMECLLTRLIS